MGGTTYGPPAPPVYGPPAPTASPTSPYTWIVGVLTGLKAPITQNNIGNVGTWLANEQTSAANWTQNQGNPLGVQTPTAIAAGKSGDVLTGLQQTISTLLSGYPTITKSLRSNAPSSVFNQAVASSSWNGSGHYGGVTAFKSKGTAQKANPTGWWGQWVEPLWGSATPPGGWNQAAASSGIPGAGGLVTGLQAPAKAVGAGVSAAKSVASGVSSISGLIGKITNPTNLKNTGIFLGGFALAVTGLVILFASTKGKQALELTQGSVKP